METLNLVMLLVIIILVICDYITYENIVKIKINILLETMETM